MFSPVDFMLPICCFSSYLSFVFVFVLFIFCPVGQNCFLVPAHAIQNDGFSFHGMLYLFVTFKLGLPVPMQEFAIVADKPVPLTLWP